MTPYEVVESKFQMPFPLFPPQVAATNLVAQLPASGLYLDVGVGKTPVATWAALFKGRQVLVLVPPILGPMWRRWLLRIPDITVVLYGGSPKDRSLISLNVDFVIMSMGIFKKDYDSILDRLDNRLTIIVDEAVSVKNVSSDCHKAVYDLFTRFDAHIMLLTGTPLSTPEDAYAYCKIIAPGAYRDLWQFYNLHVESRDFFGAVDEWKNLELIESNMKINSVRILKEDMLPYLPAVTFTPLHYDLDPQHYRLYRKLAEEEILELDGGEKIDAKSAQSLIHNLGQLICNWDHFSGDAGKVAKGVELAEEVLAELGTGKLVIVGSYRMTNRMLTARLAAYGAAAIYGEISQKQQQKNLAKFMDDPKCRVIVLHVGSGGVGVDGLQHVCSDMLILEPPSIPAHMVQVVGRLHRNGQTKPVHVRMAIAEKTLQVKRIKRLMDKDDLINVVIRNARDLRAELFGDEEC